MPRSRSLCADSRSTNSGACSIMSLFAFGAEHGCWPAQPRTPNSNTCPTRTIHKTPLRGRRRLSEGGRGVKFMTELEQNNALLNELKSQRAGLIQTKSSLESQLAVINSRCSRRLRQDDFYAAQKERALIVQQMGNVQARCAELNVAIHKCAQQDTALRQAEKQVDASPRTIVDALQKLRHKYQDFSADHTHVSSMRTMAAKFVVDLNTVIREAVNP